MSGTAPVDRDPWEAVVGQEAAVAQLRSAVDAPVHAYLLVGPAGAGPRAAARAFAGELVAAAGDAADRDRHLSLALEEQHPAITVVERVGPFITAEQAREIVRAANLSPGEGERQVMVLTDFHLVDTAAPLLLKVVEEPPASTYFVVLADEIPPELVTIASRCVQIPFGRIPVDRIEAKLIAEGIDAAAAAAAAVSAGGDLDRARLLAVDEGLIARDRFWRSIPDQLDGTGATVARLADEIEARVGELLEPLAARQAEEVARADELSEQLRGRKGDRKQLEARHTREKRRVRADELRAGLNGVMVRYREALTSGEVDAAGFVEAGQEVQRVCERLVFNPNERLALQALLLRLPPISA